MRAHAASISVGICQGMAGRPHEWTTDRIWVGSAFADDAPETADMKIGIIALTDCSPIVIAHEKGFFKKYGINSTVSKGANWAAIATRFPTATTRRRTC